MTEQEQDDQLIEEVMAGDFIGAPILLIKVLGVNPALMFRQIAIFARYHKHEHDGHKWTFNSLPGWSEATGLTPSQVRTALNKLTEMNVILRTSRYNKHGYDQTLWYAINTGALAVKVREYRNRPVRMYATSSHEKAEMNRAEEQIRIGAGNDESW